jgi:hypothetical protein
MELTELRDLGVAVWTGSGQGQMLTSCKHISRKTLQILTFIVFIINNSPYSIFKAFYFRFSLVKPRLA